MLRFPLPCAFRASALSLPVAALLAVAAAPPHTETAAAPRRSSPALPVLPPVSRSPFGINGIGFMHYWSTPEARRTEGRRRALLKRAGARWDRTELWWSVVEPEQGRFDWRAGDAMFDLYRGVGIQPLTILSYASAWSNGAAPADDAEADRFAHYAGATVRRYRHVCRAWEVWNEPNIPTFWQPKPNVSDYSRLLKKASAAIKRADPRATVVGGATSLLDLPFLRAVAREGGWDSMDVVSVHPYSLAGGPVSQRLERQLRLLQRMMAEMGRRKPVWITEMGWTAAPTHRKETEDQADAVLQTYAIALANGVQRLFWFNLVDWEEKWGLVGQDLCPKPGLEAYRVASTWLDGARFRGRVPLRDGWVYVFERDRRPVTVAWSREGAAVRLPLGSSAWVIDRAGRERRAYGTLDLTPSPVVVISADRSLFSRARRDWSEDDAENLLVNPSFEQRAGSDPAHWGRGTQYGTGKEASFVTASDAADGRIAAGVRAAKDGIWEGAPVPVYPGDLVTLDARVRAEAASGENRVELVFIDGTGWGWQSTVLSDPITGTHGWQRRKIQAKVPGGAFFARVYLHSKDNPGAVWFDALRLRVQEVSQPRR